MQKVTIILWLVFFSTLSLAVSISNVNYPSQCLIKDNHLECNVDEGNIIEVGYTISMNSTNTTEVVVSYEKPTGWVVAPSPTYFTLNSTITSKMVNVTFVSPYFLYGEHRINLTFGDNSTYAIFTIDRWKSSGQKDMEEEGIIHVTNPDFDIKLKGIVGGKADIEFSGGYIGNVNLSEGESLVKEIGEVYVNVTAMYIGSHIVSIKVMTEDEDTSLNYSGPSESGFCGDGICQSTESYLTCISDCGYPGGTLQFDFSMYELNIETGGSTNLYFTLMNTRTDKSISNINLYALRNYHTAGGEEKPLDIQQLIKTSLDAGEQMTVVVTIDAVGVPVGSYSPILVAKGFVDGQYVTAELYFDLSVLSSIVPQGALPGALSVNVPEFGFEDNEFNITITGIPLSYRVTYTHDSTINGSEKYKVDGKRIWKGTPSSTGNLFFMITIKDDSDTLIKTVQETIYVTGEETSPSNVLVLEATPSNPEPGQYVTLTAKNKETGYNMAGSTILVNGEQKTGFTAIACMKYTIVANYVGYQSASLQVDAKCYEFGGITVEPEEPKYGEVVFITALDRYGKPFPQAIIKVDGKNIAIDNSWVALDGTHKISVTHANYTEKTKSLTIPLPPLRIIENVTGVISLGQNITATFSRPVSWDVYEIDDEGYTSTKICNGYDSEMICEPGYPGFYYIEVEGDELGIVQVSSSWFSNLFGFEFSIWSWQIWAIIIIVASSIYAYPIIFNTESDKSVKKNKYSKMPVQYIYAKD